MKPPFSDRQRSPVIARWLGHEDVFWFAGAVVLGSMAFVKGCRPPGGWALIQSQFSYRYGFIKRGFLGSLYDLFGLHHRAGLARVFWVELLALAFLLVIFIYKSGLSRRFSSYAVVVLFASSYVVTFLPHLIGYSDITLAAATIALLLVRSPRTRFLLGLVVVPASILTHEAFLLWLLPSFLLSFLLDAVQSKSTRCRTLLYLLFLAVLGLTLACISSLHSSLDRPTVKAVRLKMAANSDFEISVTPMAVLRLSLRDNFRETTEMRKTPVWKYLMVYSTVDLLPATLLLLYYLRRTLQTFLKGRSILERGYVILGVATVLIAPFFLHLLAFDADRFNVMAVLVLFLTLLSVCQRLPGVTLPLSTREKAAILVVVAFNLVAVYGVFDVMITRMSPFAGRLPAYIPHK